MIAEPVAPDETIAIVVERLVKRYAERTVVEDLTFAVRRGEVFALIGPNGAGKTTTIEILEGYRAADGGTARVLGLDPRRDGPRLKRRVGVMLQQGGVYPALTAEEALRLFARFHDRPADPGVLLERVGLTAARRTRYRRLSGGQQRRLALAIALVGQPDLVFLDEPTAAMDPQARLLTWDVIRDLKARGATVLLTTHLMDEAERLADRVAIIDSGRLVTIGTPRQLLAQEARAGAAIRLVVPRSLAPGTLDRLPAVTRVLAEEDGVYRIETGEPAVTAAAVTAALRDQAIQLQELRIGGASLEDVFLRLTGKALRD